MSEYNGIKATLTSKGQVTIPIEIRRRLNLRAGQVLDFDETVPFLKATRVISPEAWNQFRAEAEKLLQKHPWNQMNSMKFMDETRGPLSLPRKRVK